MTTPNTRLDPKPGRTVPLEDFLERGEEVLASTPPDQVITLRAATNNLRVLSEQAYEQLHARAQLATNLQDRLAQAQAAADAYTADPTPANATALHQALEGLVSPTARAAGSGE